MLVKRLIAMLLGAAAGAAFMYGLSWLRAPVEVSADPVAVENCILDAQIDCVGYEPPVPATPAVEAVARPCKAWLSEKAGVAALSLCLHEARRERDALQVENFKRAQRIAASS
jgi:hypothetical protein